MASVFDRLFQKRSISFQTLWGNGDELVLGNQSGTYVTQDSVFKVNAIFSAVSLIADTISTLPLDAYIRIDGERRAFRPRPEWVQKPDVDLVSKEPFYNAVIVSMLLDGNAFVRVYRDASGRVLNLVVLNPRDVEVVRKSLKSVGVAEARFYDKALIDKAEQELKRQYVGKGMYAAEVVATIDRKSVV